MKDLAKSGFIFDLIDEFEIFTFSGTVNEFTDEAYYAFSDKYKILSKQRDLSLFQYLHSTPNIFRSHLPHSSWSLSVAFNVVWYYDELIVSDPVLKLLNSDAEELEKKKYKLVQLLSFLKECKGSIDVGYLLFSGEHITPDNTGFFEDASKSLVEIPEVYEAFERITILGKKPSPINGNIADNLTHLEVMYQGLWRVARTMGVYVPPHVLQGENGIPGVMYNFMTPYEPLTKEELIGFGKVDMLDSLKREYCRDIEIVLDSIRNAQRLNSPVLFYRDVDCIAAKNYAHTTNAKEPGIIADTSIYDCLAPYIDGIPPERLADVRDQIPEAFIDFRAFLFDLVKRTMKNIDDPTEIKFRIESEINAKLRQLSTEMSNAKRKWEFHGVAAPLLLLAGSFSFFSSGIDYSQFISALLGSGGAIKSLTTFGDVKSDKDKAALNPVYFLWKAQKG